MRTWTLILVSLMSLSAFAAVDTNSIEQNLGKGAWNAAEGVFKVTVPRTDVKVTVDGVPLPPFMGLATWAAFTEDKMHGAMVMGDTVLFEDEVNPVMSVALENGLSVTALHNHFFYDDPKVYFMHIGGEGSAAHLSAVVRKVWDKVKEIRNANPQPAKSFGGPPLPETNSITAKPIEDLLGLKGQGKNGMFKIVIGHPTKMMDTRIDKEMGANTWAVFAGVDENALVDGDFAVAENQLQPVLRALRHHGINIVAIHSHMTEENPRVLFLHYWGRGSAKDLAMALKSALDAQSATK